jgi:hypothetical protein
MITLDDWADCFIRKPVTHYTIQQITESFTENFSGFQNFTARLDDGQIKLTINFARPADETFFRLKYA